MNTAPLLQDIVAAVVEQPVQYVFVNDSELVHVGGGASTALF